MNAIPAPSPRCGLRGPLRHRQDHPGRCAHLEIRPRGYRVGALKHDAHRFEIDRPGKDSARFTAAGAEVMVLVSDDTVAMVQKTRGAATTGNVLAGLVHRYGPGPGRGLQDQRPAQDRGPPGRIGQPLLCRGEPDDPHLLAVASDGPADSLKELDVPVLDLDDPAAIADFIEESLLKSPRIPDMLRESGSALHSNDMDERFPSPAA